MSGKANLLDVEVYLHAETDKAVRVSDDGDNESAVWLPKSQIEIVHHKGTIIVTLPEWLAVDKGLV